MKYFNPEIMIEKACSYPSTVLITGETGTGKSHLAEYIHENSSRKGHAFVCINLASYPETLIESELFGCEKGAYSGAFQKRHGKLHLAHKGTLFLDEIGELPLHLQVKILHFLQTKRYTPLGDNRERFADVRIIAATNQPVEELVQRKCFRKDLYYRLNVIRISIDPLRKQREKIMRFTGVFIDELNRTLHTKILGLDEEAKRHLLQKDWPGNLRQLRNSLECAMIVRGEGWLCKKDFDDFLQKNPPLTDFESLEFPTDFKHSREAFERAFIKQVLSRFGGRINETARRAKISKSTLLEKIRHYKIDAAKYHS
jgi:transcriptional regulator with PAS, ATPase and Fis domain